MDFVISDIFENHCVDDGFPSVENVPGVNTMIDHFKNKGSYVLLSVSESVVLPDFVLVGGTFVIRPVCEECFVYSQMSSGW